MARAAVRLHRRNDDKRMAFLMPRKESTFFLWARDQRKQGLLKSALRRARQGYPAD